MCLICCVNVSFGAHFYSEVSLSEIQFVRLNVVYGIDVFDLLCECKFWCTLLL